MIEHLEHRRMLSTSQIVGGILVVQLESTGGNVTIQESANAGTGNTALVVDSNLGTFTNFSGVKSIVVLGGAGDDTINVISQNVPLFINGGAGNDTIGVVINPVDIFTGDGVTTPALYGVFNSSYNGSGSVILGGDGDDRIVVAGLSNSVVLGGNGSDFIVAGGVIATFSNINGVPETEIGGGDHMVISGGSGDDTLMSGFDGAIAALTDSILLGGTGNDTITDINTTDGNIINGGPGTDTITVAAASPDQIVGNTAGDIITTV